MTISEFVKLALLEDAKEGDHTSNACIPESARRRARLLIKEDGIIAGIEKARQIFYEIDPVIQFESRLTDGARVKFGDIGFTVEGPARSILLAERLVLNLMQRMSGIATMSSRVVEAAGKTNAKILDTRKTTPLLRSFEKEAVRIGGAHNHRFSLDDMIMIKDNHVDYAGGIEAAIAKTKNYVAAKSLDIKIEIEVRNFDELNEVLEIGGVDRIMLDNFSPEEIKEAMSIIDGRFETEASGGITIESIAVYADTGVDFISMGALTHSVKSLDMSLKAY